MNIYIIKPGAGDIFLEFNIYAYILLLHRRYAVRNAFRVDWVYVRYCPIIFSQNICVFSMRKPVLRVYNHHNPLYLYISSSFFDQEYIAKPVV